MEATVTHRTFTQTTVYLINVESNKPYAGVWKAEKHVGGWQGVAKLPVARSGSAKTRGTWRSRASRDYSVGVITKYGSLSILGHIYMGFVNGGHYYGQSVGQNKRIQ